MDKLVLIIALLFLSFGLWSVCRLLYAYIKNRSIKNWPTADGVIIKSKAIKIGPSAEDSSYYLPKVIYEFTVMNEKYTSSKVKMNYIFSSTKYCSEETVKKYQEGEVVRVYFNKNKPSEAYLESGIDIGQILIALIGALIAFVFSYLMLSDISL